jgi:hypothetical protein
MRTPGIDPGSFAKFAVEGGSETSRKQLMGSANEISCSIEAVRLTRADSRDRSAVSGQMLITK